MEKLIRKVNAEQFNSFYYFSWGFYFYFSAGYWFCNKIWKNLSNEYKENRLLLASIKI